MKTIILFLLCFSLVGCTTYTATDVQVSGITERTSVEISKDNTQVNISISEQPRRVTKYDLAYPLSSQLICIGDYLKGEEERERRVYSISNVWQMDGGTIVKEGNHIFSYPRLDGSSFFDGFSNINYPTNISMESNFITCTPRFNFIINVTEYVDGIKISFYQKYFGSYDVYNQYISTSYDCTLRNHDNFNFRQCEGDFNRMYLQGQQQAYDVEGYIRGLR